MTSKKIKVKKLLPVFMSFVVMGFVDIVGVSTGYVKEDFSLSDSMAKLIPAMAFLWFFILSVPTGILQDRFGKRKILNIGMAITGLGMAIPFINYSFPLMLVAFIFLGIGNTIVQVSANPLLHDVSSEDKFASLMSFTQFLKAVISWLGPILATIMARQFGSWLFVFEVYAITSFIAVAWLGFTKIEESKPRSQAATFKSCFSLLGDKYILIMVLAIFLLVGADVGMNSNIQNFLSSVFGLSIEEASFGISIYFAGLLISRLLGSLLLNWIKPRGFLLITVFVALVSVVGMLVSPTVLVVKITIFMIGLGSGNLFPLIFSIAVNKMPDRVNEISGLMIMAVSGGALIPPIIGIVSDSISAFASMFVIMVCLLYILGISLYTLKK